MKVGGGKEIRTLTLLMGFGLEHCIPEIIMNTFVNHDAVIKIIKFNYKDNKRESSSVSLFQNNDAFFLSVK